MSELYVELCECGARVLLTELALRLGARTVGCKSCRYTGKRPAWDPKKPTEGARQS